MTTANSTAPDGVLVLGEDGGASWWAPQPPAVAAVELGVGEGAVVRVDAGDPSRVLAWAVAPGGDFSALAAAFGDTGFEHILTQASTGQDPVTVYPAPRLAGPWMRCALVAAVQRWSMRPVDEGALLLDEAASRHRTGNAAAAARLFALGSPILMALGHQCLEGELVGGPASELREISLSAGLAVAETGWGKDILDLAASLQSVTSIDDRALESILREWDLEDVSVGGAADMGGDAAPLGILDEVRVSSARIDPSLVPARVLEWRGADQYELFLEHRNGADEVLVSAELAVDVDPLCLEVQQLFAFCAHPETGRLIAAAPMQVDGRRVHTRVPLRGADPGSVHIGVFYADTDLDALRVDRVGQLLVTVDRWMLDAWSHQRCALAAVHTVPVDAASALIDAAAQIRDDHLDLSFTAATTAAQEIDDHLVYHRDELTEDTVVALIARREAIQSYLDNLDTVATSEATAMPSLLAEMLPVESWIDEDYQ